jgi:hypothetical protein
VEAERGRTDSVTSHVSPARTTAISMPPFLSPTGGAVHALAAQSQAAHFLHDPPTGSTCAGPPRASSSSGDHLPPVRRSPVKSGCGGVPGGGRRGGRCR